MMAGVLPPAAPAPSLNAQAGVALAVAGVAVAVDLAIYGIARWIGVPMALPEPGSGDPPTLLPIGAVVAAAFVAVALAAGTLALLRQYQPERATTTFVLAAAVFLAVSLYAPLSADATAATKIALVLMHLATGAITIVGLTLAVARRRPAPS